MAAQAADCPSRPAGLSSSVGLAAWRAGQAPAQGCPRGAPDGAALTMVWSPATQAAGRATGRKAAMRLLILAAPALLAAMPHAAAARGLDLEPGLFVVQGEPCKGATSTAMLSFDGRQFDNKGVQCRLETTGRSGDSHAVTCMEGGDASTRETRRWSFRLIDRRSFSINGSVFRLCPVQP